MNRPRKSIQIVEETRSTFAKLMKSKVGIDVVLVGLILAISLSESAATALVQPGRANDWSAHPLIHIRPAATTSPRGLSPTQIRIVYNLPSTGGSGTIAIVNAYDDPTALNDLNVFSSQFSLPLVNSTNFEKHIMTPTISMDSGWALETSLDVQWAHAIAPNAKILLVEARSNSLIDLLAAVNYARNRPEVVAISMSWGGSEFYTESSFDSYFSSPYGASFFASSGDSGAGALWPAVSANAIGVGGTTLTFYANGSLATETAWSGSGGGKSAYEAEPSYQSSYGIPGANSARCVPDVSYDADPNSGVSVYDSTRYNGWTGWWQVGGTSAGAPQWAAIHSLGLAASNSNFYQAAKSSSHSSYFRDITSGSNGAYNATAGYDYVTGLGSPLTTNYASATTPDFSISVSPSALTIPAGASGTTTIKVTSLNGFSGTISLVASASSGLDPSLDQYSLMVASGGSNSSTLTITAQSDTKAGPYTVTVSGRNGSSSHSAAATANVQTSPSAPQNLKATAGNSQVTLSWSAPPSDGGALIASYKIYRSTTAGTETLLTTVGNMLSNTDTTVTNGQTYYYVVTAVNLIGESNKSNEANATPSAPSAKTLNVTVTTDRTTYSGWAYVSIKVTIKDGATGNGLRGASVKVTVNYPNGSAAWTASGITDSGGTARFYYYITRQVSQRGTYTVAATASLATYQTGTGQTVFNVS